MRHTLVTCTMVLAGLVALPSAGLAAEPSKPQPEKLTRGLVLPPVGRYGRSPVPQDWLEAQRVAGKWSRPKEGDTVPVGNGTTRKWEVLKAGADGTFSHPALGGGYAYFAVESA